MSIPLFAKMGIRLAGLRGIDGTFLPNDGVTIGIDSIHVLHIFDLVLASEEFGPYLQHETLLRQHQVCRLPTRVK